MTRFGPFDATATASARKRRAESQQVADAAAATPTKRPAQFDGSDDVNHSQKQARTKSPIAVQRSNVGIATSLLKRPTLPLLHVSDVPAASFSQDLLRDASSRARSRFQPRSEYLPEDVDVASTPLRLCLDAEEPDPGSEDAIKAIAQCLSATSSARKGTRFVDGDFISSFLDDMDGILEKRLLVLQSEQNPYHIEEAELGSIPTPEMEALKQEKDTWRLLRLMFSKRIERKYANVDQSLSSEHNTAPESEVAVVEMLMDHDPEISEQMVVKEWLEEIHIAPARPLITNADGDWPETRARLASSRSTDSSVPAFLHPDAPISAAYPLDPIDQRNEDLALQTVYDYFRKGDIAGAEEFLNDRKMFWRAATLAGLNYWSYPPFDRGDTQRLYEGNVNRELWRQSCRSISALKGPSTSLYERSLYGLLGGIPEKTLATANSREDVWWAFQHALLLNNVERRLASVRNQLGLSTSLTTCDDLPSAATDVLAAVEAVDRQIFKGRFRTCDFFWSAQVAIVTNKLDQFICQLAEVIQGKRLDLIENRNISWQQLIRFSAHLCALMRFTKYIIRSGETANSTSSSSSDENGAHVNAEAAADAILLHYVQYLVDQPSLREWTPVYVSLLPSELQQVSAYSQLLVNFTLGKLAAATPGLSSSSSAASASSSLSSEAPEDGKEVGSALSLFVAAPAAEAQLRPFELSEQRRRHMRSYIGRAGNENLPVESILAATVEAGYRKALTSLAAVVRARGNGTDGDDDAGESQAKESKKILEKYVGFLDWLSLDKELESRLLVYGAHFARLALVHGLEDIARDVLVIIRFDSINRRAEDGDDGGILTSAAEEALQELRAYRDLLEAVEAADEWLRQWDTSSDVWGEKVILRSKEIELVNSSDRVGGLLAEFLNADLIPKGAAANITADNLQGRDAELASIRKAYLPTLFLKLHRVLYLTSGLIERNSDLTTNLCVYMSGPGLKRTFGDGNDTDARTHDRLQPEDTDRPDYFAEMQATGTVADFLEAQRRNALAAISAGKGTAGGKVGSRTSLPESAGYGKRYDAIFDGRGQVQGLDLQFWKSFRD